MLYEPLTGHPYHWDWKSLFTPSFTDR